MLSIYYVTATFLQSWRIKKACTKIAETFTEKSSVVFYVLPKEGYEANQVTSELCTNRSEAKVCELLWMFADRRGCCLTPLQSLHIGPWVTFPHTPTLIPFECSSAASDELILDRNNLVHLLLETDIIPSSVVGASTENVMIEQYGKPIAWKVDSHLAVLLETDINHFTNLLIATFLQNNLYINDSLPLFRIESVTYEGQPQPYQTLKKHLRKQLTSRSEVHLCEEDWQRHLEGLRSMSVLANQATEFEYNKNRTEGKTGIVKPDLIPSGKVSSDLPTQSIEDVVESRKSSPNKAVGEKQKIEAKVSPMKRAPEEPAIKMESPAKGLESKREEIKLSPKPTEVLVTVEPKPSHLVEPIVTAKVEPTPRKTPEKVSKASISPSISSKKVEKKADILPKKAPEPVSSVKSNTKRPSLRRSKDSVRECKPPNILVYSDVATSRDNVIATLKNILVRDRYTVYPLTPQQVQEKSWIDNTCLLVICGSVSAELGEILVDYFLRGGKLLSLCSDVLHIVLPTYRTAEVREHELVQFSYDKWQKVKMMHYIFCYHPSPVKKNFSTDSDESNATLAKKPALVCPRSIELKDLQGDMHNLDVKVLGSEETWNTPSLLLANNMKSGGRAVFSQVHLETDPSEYETDDGKFRVLKDNEKNRLEIFADLLNKHLGLTIREEPLAQGAPKITYQNAYFLGRHELKFEVLEKLKSSYNADNMIPTSKLSIKFCGKNETPPSAKTDVLPILIHHCPEDFSTVDYFDNLSTKYIGRLVIYAPIVSSTMHIVSDLELSNGIVVLARQQTQATGRSNNQWLSPIGCAMFSLQLHVPLSTPLGSKLSLIQIIIGLSVVSAIKQLDMYQFLDLGVKWPNDIYINGLVKVGGLIVNSKCMGSTAIINIGLGFNLDNKTPTVCINDLVEEHNRSTHQQIPPLGYERTLALIFNEIERLIDLAQDGQMDTLYELYYKYWLHDQQEVEIQDRNGRKENATVIGIDDYGFLKIKTRKGKIESVQPDGNSFDMLKGLIIPKFY